MISSNLGNYLSYLVSFVDWSPIAWILAQGRHTFSYGRQSFPVWSRGYFTRALVPLEVESVKAKLVQDFPLRKEVTLEGKSPGIWKYKTTKNNASIPSSPLWLRWCVNECIYLCIIKNPGLGEVVIDLTSGSYPPWNKTTNSLCGTH